MTLPPGNDDLHRPISSSPWLTETAWYSFWTTDRRYAVHAYLRFRPNLGTADSCIYAWRAGASAPSPWEAVYWKHVHQSIPESLVDVEFLSGLHHLQRSPFCEYTLTYDDKTSFGDAFGFEIGATSLDEPRYFGTKHLDQPMRMTGRLQVGGELLDVDCRAMRDRSWYRRSDFQLFRSAYSYFVDDESNLVLALFAAPDISRDEPPSQVLPLVGGHVRDGRGITDLGTGVRTVLERHPATGAPDVVEVSVTDRDGQELRMVGRSTGALAVAANTNMMSWMSLMEWQHGGDDTAGGRTIVGEDQEIWSPSIWRAFRNGVT